MRTPWSLRLLIARLRPFTRSSILRYVIIAGTFGLFLSGDYALFHRLFSAVAQIEEATPFFAIGLLRNFVAMAMLAATTVLLSSALTSSIGSFFTDLDLDIYHAAPISRERVILARWGKTLVQSAAIVFVFLIPLFAAFGHQYHARLLFYPIAIFDLLLLLSIPVSLGSLTIVLLVRFFPVRRVHQIVATLAILVLTTCVVAFRMSRPERFFTTSDSTDLSRVLHSIELPSMEHYPGTGLADVVSAEAEHRPVTAVPWVIGVPALLSFALFFLVARSIYFVAFVRARESMAPSALGGATATGILDRMLAPFDLATRAMVGKEIRILLRDVAQWSQLFLMGALLFLYLYNIRTLPLGGDVRATLVAYGNLGMAGFVIAAICLRFAYPSVSAEGKAFWMLQSAPISYRKLLVVKVFVYSVPLTGLALLLTVFANLLLDADRMVWMFTLSGASLLGVTLVSLGVGLGGLAPDFNLENPLQVGLSLGGFGYMGIALTYVASIMLLMSRPIMQYVVWRLFGTEADRSLISFIAPIVIAVTTSVALSVSALILAERRLRRLGEI